MNKNEILAAYHFRHAQKFMTQTFIHNKKKQNSLKNMAKCKFCDDAHHAKFQQVFRFLKAAPFLV